jgi:hypothetical protein
MDQRRRPASRTRVVRTSLGWELKVGCVDIQKAVNEAVKKSDLFGPENVAPKES